MPTISTGSDIKNRKTPSIGESSEVPHMDPGINHADNNRKTIARDHNVTRSARELSTFSDPSMVATISHTFENATGAPAHHPRGAGCTASTTCPARVAISAFEPVRQTRMRWPGTVLSRRIAMRHRC